MLIVDRGVVYHIRELCDHTIKGVDDDTCHYCEGVRYDVKEQDLDLNKGVIKSNFVPRGGLGWVLPCDIS